MTVMEPESEDATSPGSGERVATQNAMVTNYTWSEVGDELDLDKYQLSS